MNDYVDPILVGSGVHLPCYIDFRPTGTHGSHHSTCERLPIPPRDRADARKHSRTVQLIIPHNWSNSTSLNRSNSVGFKSIVSRYLLDIILKLV